MASSVAAQLVTLSILALQRQMYHNRGLNRTSWNQSYDFVVVGSGTAGSIVAGRLSANPRVTVLLVEAGPPLTITSDITPTVYWFNHDWGYRTTPQKNAAFGLANRQVPTPRGKILGGSHATNFAAYTRGNQQDYNNWAHHYGATGWTYREVLPFFLRSENNTDPAVVAANPDYHSTSGPVEVSTIPNPDPILFRWLNATAQLGWPISDYNNGARQFGSNIMQTTQSATNWTRQTTAAAFIEVNIERPNLHVLVNAHVTRILFDSGTIPTATGIEFVRDNQTYQVRASREVILSAGSINSPQLLMLSGIGPRDHLAQFGIPTLVDLPGVGSNLYEHFLVPYDFWATNASDIGYSGNMYYNLNVENLYNYFAHASGPLTRLQLTETYIPTGINGDRDWPDGMLYFLFNQIAPSAEAVVNVYDQSHRSDWLRYLTQFENDNRHLWIAFSQFRPVSSGTVRLASRDPFTAPSLIQTISTIVKI